MAKISECGNCKKKKVSIGHTLKLKLYVWVCPTCDKGIPKVTKNPRT